MAGRAGGKLLKAEIYSIHYDNCRYSAENAADKSKTCKQEERPKKPLLI